MLIILKNRPLNAPWHILLRLIHICILCVEIVLTMTQKHKWNNKYMYIDCCYHPTCTSVAHKLHYWKKKTEKYRICILNCKYCAKNNWKVKQFTIHILRREQANAHEEQNTSDDKNGYHNHSKGIKTTNHEWLWQWRVWRWYWTWCLTIGAGTSWSRTLKRKTNL